jgi:tRNA-modifying protein YgfZ
VNKVQLLKDRAVMVISGADCFNFLQGLITNDITKIQKDESKLLYALMLTPQGKFLYDFFLHAKDGNIYLDHHARFTQEILNKMKFYKLRSQVELSVSDYKVVFSETNFDQDIFFDDPRSSALGYRGYLADVAQFDLENGIYEKIIYDNIIPEPHQDMEQNKSFPIEFAMDEYNAISFTKGCYVGQENTSRTKYRGTVRKKMHKFIANREIVGIETGAEIFVGSVKIGNYCSSFGNMGKALMRIEEFESCASDKANLCGYELKFNNLFHIDR